METKRRGPKVFRNYEVTQKDIFGKLGVFVVTWRMFLKDVKKTFPKGKVKRIP